MKKYAGKITIGLIIAIIVAVGITWTINQDAKAATVASRTFVLISNTSVTHTTNTYLVLWERQTGNIVDKSTGVIAAAEDWADNAITTDGQHGQNTAAWTYTLPALDSNKEYVMGVYSNGTPADDDAPTMGPFLYDPVNNITFSDTNPIRSKNVGVKTR